MSGSLRPEAVRRVVTRVPGYDREIGRLVFLLSHSRGKLVSVVQHCDASDLDYQHDERSNTIGAILAHLIALEYDVQKELFGRSALGLEEARQWSAGFYMWDRARYEIRGMEVTQYISIMNRMRAFTIAELRHLADPWLDEIHEFGNGLADSYFRLYHLVEEESAHGGQIIWILIRRWGIDAHNNIYTWRKQRK